MYSKATRLLDMSLGQKACVHYASCMHKDKSWALIMCVINKSLLVNSMQHAVNVHVCTRLTAYD